MTAAKRRMLKAEGIHDLQCLGFPIGPTTPVAGLEAMLNEAERNVVNLRVKVANLVDLIVEETGPMGAHKLMAHPLWTIYCQERDRYADLCIGIAKLGFDKVRLGIEERQLQIEEREAAQLAHVIDGVLTRAGLDPKAIDVRSWVLAEIEAAEEAA